MWPRARSTACRPRLRSTPRTCAACWLASTPWGWSVKAQLPHDRRGSRHFYHIRWRIAGLLPAIITLTLIDRFNMSVAAKYIQQEFQLSNVQVGSLLSAFVKKGG